MNLLLDTNVLIAALISRGFCFDLLEHCIRQHRLIFSSFILKEFNRTLLNKFHFARKEVMEATELIFSRMEKVEPTSVKKSACRDPDDVIILGTALAGNCRYLITGDKDLLQMVSFQKIPIISPRDFWRLEIPKRSG